VLCADRDVVRVLRADLGALGGGLDGAHRFGGQRRRRLGGWVGRAEQSGRGGGDRVGGDAGFVEDRRGDPVGELPGEQMLGANLAAPEPCATSSARARHARIRGRSVTSGGRAGAAAGAPRSEAVGPLLREWVGWAGCGRRRAVSSGFPATTAT